MADSNPELFSVERHDVDGTVVLSLRGECDLSNAEQLSSAIEETGASALLIDLSELDFIDSTGLKVIVSAVKTARRENRWLTLRAGAPPVMRVFEITGLDKTLPFE